MRITVIRLLQNIQPSILPRHRHIPTPPHSESHMFATTWRCQLWALHIIKPHPPPAPPPCSVITPVHPPPSRYYGVAPTSRLPGLHLKVSFEKEPFFSGALLQTTLSNLERLQILATTHFNQTPRCVGCGKHCLFSSSSPPHTHTLSRIQRGAFSSTSAH